MKEETREDIIKTVGKKDGLQKEKIENRLEIKEIPEEAFEEKVVQIDRVTRVVKGGRRMRFRALVVVGDKNGKVGLGVAKGNEVAVAVRKAVGKAKNKMITISLKGTTIEAL
ncbi:MAG: hypothetical protein M1355_02450, partial [Patescibacteria group bacterium]|nr:hypothetical protein [Patescibacteria group bacterium]